MTVDASAPPSPASTGAHTIKSHPPTPWKPFRGIRTGPYRLHARTVPLEPSGPYKSVQRDEGMSTRRTVPPAVARRHIFPS